MPVDIGQPPLDAVVIKAQPLVIHAEQMQQRRVQIINGRDVLDCFVAELVRVRNAF